MTQRTVLTGVDVPGVATLPDALVLGAVHLTVTDLDRSVAWYQRALGLRVHRHELAEAALGAGGDDVLVLHEQPGARPAGRHAGLFHYALLLPNRQELARAALRLTRTRTSIQGASDHGTHEAIYLPDLDGNGIELAADRPRAQWPTPQEEFSGGGPRPLDVDGLLSSVSGTEAEIDRVEPGLRIGHLHLHVGDIDEGLAFYRDIIGFAVWAVLPRSAAFVAAGGYHHHLGFNVWKGHGVGPAPADTVGLRHWTVVLPTMADVDEVRGRVRAAEVAERDVDHGFAVSDPWRNELQIVAAE